MSDRPVAYWRLEETTGPVAHDSSGMNRPGRYYSGTTFGTVVSVSLGYGLTDGAVEVPYGDWTNFTAMTLEMWVRPNRVVYTQAILMFARGDAWQLQVTRDGYPAFTYPGGTRGARAATPFVVGQLYHVTATFTPRGPGDEFGYLRLYLDGEFAGEAPTFDPLPNDRNPMQIGRGFGCCLGFVGMIDEVALYDRVLGVERIKAHSDAGR
jgi:hypothetical protein